MKAKLLSLWCCASLAFVLVGCGKKSEVDTSKLETSFATAEPATKSQSAKVVDAIKGADYSGALASLKSLAGDAKLTAEQKAAIQDVTDQVQKLIKDTASKAVEGGQKSLEDAKKALPK